MKCDVVFSRLKRFKFEKIKKNFARLWPNWSNAMAENNKCKLNLRSRVKKNQNFPILLLERQSTQLSKQAVTSLEPFLRKKPQMFKNYLRLPF